ncbi:helix-turn-helix transcriptional regulator [Streptomyces sp. AV19]|nr:helix-turn-helix transcriptional regulator [Streptomyces sp. AV19]
MPAPKGLDPSASLAALYGAKLRKLRIRAGWTQRELGDKVPIAHSRIAQFELGKEVPHPKVSDRLDELLGAGGDLKDLREAIEKAPYVDWAVKYIEYEAKAIAMHKYLSQSIPGLLQIEAYAREVIGHAQPWLTAVEIDLKVAARLDRQKLLARSDPPLLWAVLDEAVLRRPVGGPAVMREQLLRVLEAARKPKVEVQVLPFSAGGHASMGGSLTMLSFKARPDVAYLEGGALGELVRDRATVARHSHWYHSVHAMALPMGPSVKLIEQLAEDYGKCAS